jgi:hypothetical protein
MISNRSPVSVEAFTQTICHSMLYNADVLGRTLRTSHLPDNFHTYAFLSMSPSKASPNPGTLVQGSTRYGARTQATSELSLHTTPFVTSSS